eukprot:6532517-Pyramimonas_sp.AAC.1
MQGSRFSARRTRRWPGSRRPLLNFSVPSLMQAPLRHVRRPSPAAWEWAPALAPARPRFP